MARTIPNANPTNGTGSTEARTGPSKAALRAEGGSFTRMVTAEMKTLEKRCQFWAAYAGNHGIDLAEIAPELPRVLEALGIGATATATAGA